MNVEFLLQSSTEGSETILIIKNVCEGNNTEVLLNISNSSEEQNIYVLLKDLKIALDALVMLEKK